MAKKSKGHRAHVITEAEAAALNFEPWQGPIDYKILPTNEAFTEHGLGHLVVCRLAIELMYKTKAELMETMGDNEEDAVVALLDSLSAAKNFFSHFSKLVGLLEAAELRMVCAGSCLQGGPCC